MSTLETVSYKALLALSSTPLICALEYPKEKKVLLFASDNPCIYLSSLISRIITKKHGSQELYRDRKKLKLIVLETGVSDKWSVSYWHNEYSRNGYKFYSLKKPLDLNLHVKVNYKFGVLVELRNKAGKAIVIGVFNTMSEAEEWIDLAYPDLEYINPLFAINKETIEYYSLTSSRNTGRV